MGPGEDTQARPTSWYKAWVNAAKSSQDQPNLTNVQTWVRKTLFVWDVDFLCRSTTVITKTLVNTPKHIPNTTHNICKTILTHKVYKVLWQFLLHFFFFMLGATHSLKNTVLDKLLWIFSLQYMRMYHTVYSQEWLTYQLGDLMETTLPPKCVNRDNNIWLTEWSNKFNMRSCILNA